MKFTECMFGRGGGRLLSRLARLSTGMEVTVRDRDVTVEHTGMCLLRVTGMTVLNHFSHYIVRTDVSFVAFLVESC